MTENNPADAVRRDEEKSRAPNPRRHYASPEDLLEDIEIEPSAREALLMEWKDEVDAQLAAEAEGMSASDPIRAETEAMLAAEARRVNAALQEVRAVNAASIS